MLKILMVNTPDSVKAGGGDVVQMRCTADALRALGAEVSLSFDRDPNATGFDIAHVFNLRTIHVTPHQVQSLTRFGIPIVLSPIYFNPSLAIWGHLAVRSVFTMPLPPEERARYLDLFARHRLRLTQKDQPEVAAGLENRIHPDNDDIQRRVVDAVRHLLPNSYLEQFQLARTLGAVKPFTIVPYGVDAETFLDADPEPFVQKYGLRDFVLSVGRIEWSKNQLMLAYALRESGVPLVLIGHSFLPQYRELCQSLGPPDLRIIDRLEHGELRHAYAAARVHALPSWLETCGLVNLEAALANCDLVVSTAGYEVEYVRNLAEYCDPASIGSIRAAVLSAFQNTDGHATRRAALKKLILQEYTWQRAGQMTLEAYRQALGNRPPVAPQSRIEPASSGSERG